MLIFGGWTEKESPCLPSHIQVLCDGKWRCVQTRGILFTAENAEGVEERVLFNFRTAQLIGDKVYLMATTVTKDEFGVSWIGGLVDKIFVLDLATWTWTDLAPKGNAPIMAKGNVSWIHQDKIYVFGGIWRGDVGLAYSLNYPTGRHEVTFDTNMTNQGYITMLFLVNIQASAKRWSPGYVNFVPDVAYHFCLAAFLQPRDHLLADSCKIYEILC